MNKVFGALVAGMIVGIPAIGEVLQNWEFDEPTGTLLGNTLNSGNPGDASWNRDLPFATDGLGHYRIGDGVLGFGYAGCTPDFLDGILTLEVVLDSWDLDEVLTSEPGYRNFYVMFWERVGGDLQRLLGLLLHNATDDRLRLRLVVGDTVTDLPGYGDGEMPIINPGTPYTFGVTLDAETDAYAAYVIVNGVRDIVAVGNLVPQGQLETIVLAAANSDWGTGDDYLNVDRITLSTSEPWPSTWGPYPVSNGYCDTTPWMGWLWVGGDPWIWSVDLDKWFHCPGDTVGEGGAWVYMPK